MSTLLFDITSQYGTSEYGTSQYGESSDIDDAYYDSLGFTSVSTFKNVWNEYDEFGLLVNIPRIIGEKKDKKKIKFNG
jgi:hypothetical protein